MPVQLLWMKWAKFMPWTFSCTRKPWLLMNGLLTPSLVSVTVSKALTTVSDYIEQKTTVFWAPGWTRGHQEGQRVSCFSHGPAVWCSAAGGHAASALCRRPRTLPLAVVGWGMGGQLPGHTGRGYEHTYTHRHKQMQTYKHSEHWDITQYNVHTQTTYYTLTEHITH